MGADIDKDEDSFTKGGDLGYILLPLRGTDMDGGDTISRALQFGFLLPILGADVDKDGDAATNGAYLKYILLPFITHKKAPTPKTIGIGAFLVKD